jgi:5'-3' exoribonuclease 2
MGVPGFFLWLMKNYKNEGFVFNKTKISEIKAKSEINNIDYFLIDANCLIHPVCYKIIAENQDITDNDILENKMYIAVLEYLDKLIYFVEPKKGIYLAIDGVAPVAKIKQQRSRRFKSVADKIMWDNIKRKYDRPLSHNWNSNAITPGTEFMVKLHNKIIDWAYKLKKNVYYSSCFTPAEGEHKLLQFIRSNQRENNDFSYVVYGLDADLIFLSLATESDKIYLLREASEINRKESKEDLNYVSIRIMKKSIVNTIKYYLEKSFNSTINIKVYGFINDTRIVNDFIFMCYFLGNDFLPHIPSLDIHKSGIESLIIAYTETIDELIINKSIQYLLNVNQINTDFLELFINKLSKLEENILREHYAKGRRRMRCNGDYYEKEVFKIENLQFKIDDPIQLGSDTPEKWRARYYKHYWDISDDNIEKFSEELVRNYMTGLKWVTLYYFDECPSWDWYYPFDYPPFISDIAKYLSTINLNNINFIKGKPLKPFMQLLSVLPPQSNNLIPKGLRKLMLNKKSSLAYMYPTKFDQEFINKTKHWMAIPKLPPLNIKLVKHIYNKYQDELNLEEKERNIIKKPLVINNT